MRHRRYLTRASVWLRKRVTTVPEAIRLPVAARLPLFIALLAAVATLIVVADVGHRSPPPVGFSLPWPLLAAGFAAAELKVVVVHFRRESHSFTLSEFPTVVALFLLPPGEFLLAVLVGSAVSLVFGSRQPAIKIVFNLANFALTAAVSLAVFYRIVPAAGILDSWAWVAAFAATMAATLVAALSIATAITLSGGAPQFEKLPEMLQFGGMVAVANTSLALLVVSVLATNPSLVALLILPVIIVFVAYRAYVSEREKHERLELLYQSSRILQYSSELDSALVALLEHTRTMFRARRAEVVLYSRSAGGDALRTVSHFDEPPVAMVPWAIGDDALQARVLAEARPFFSRTDVHGTEAPGDRQVMVSPLRGESGIIGSMLVAHRITQGTAFTDDDLRLLETLANQAATALENGQLEQSLAELSRLKEQLRYQAYHDSLTDLANRSLFLEALEERLAARTGNLVPVVLFLDLDDFKVVNDTKGHAAGDRLLIAVAERVRRCVRQGDIPARLGGDEFAILIDDLPDLKGATAIADRILGELRLGLSIASEETFVGASIGIAVGIPGTSHATEVLRNADVAMYTAKSSGKDRVVIFDPTMHSAIVARHELASDLSRSLGRGELLLHYQPIVSLASGQIEGVEALVRWRHPTRGLLGPDEFVGLAEENGTILALDRWVLAEACRQVADWSRAMPERPLLLTVNHSAADLQQPNLVADVEQVLREAWLPPEQLCLEMTETVLLHDTTTTIARLAELRALGIRIAIDDFGTGYSSLGYLRRFRVDYLKIAQEFVGNEEGDRDEWAFAHAIVALGQTLDLRIIAEGIETQEQERRLRGLGCEFGQGFLFSRPVGADDMEAMLRRERRATPTLDERPVLSPVRARGVA